MSAGAKVEAGPEFDALIAQKVMGWRPGIMPRGTEAWFTSPEGDWKTANWIPRKDFQPSLQIADAWQVVVRMNEEGFSFHFFQLNKEGASVSFICGRGPCPQHGNPHHNHHGAYDIEASTAPLAICLAALEAKGITA